MRQCILVCNKSDERSVEEYLSTAVLHVVGAINGNHLQELLEHPNSIQVSLEGGDTGLVVTTLKLLNESVELKPNLAGFGLNINALIHKYLSTKRRRLGGHEST
jgi:hypothetical protein